MLLSQSHAETPQARFAAMLTQHRGIVFKVAHTYSQHTQDRQDLAQEIATQLWRAFPSYDNARPFATWMYRIALNVGISHLRKAAPYAKRTVGLEDSHEQLAVNPDEHLDGDDQVRALHAVIEQLAPFDRALLLLYLDERSQRDIGDVLGISETNVATKLMRLKQRIREHMIPAPGQQKR